MKQLQAVLFDLGGVLFRYDPERRWQAFAEQTDLPADEVRRRLSSSGYAMACDQGRFRGDRAYLEGIRALGCRMSMERFVQIWVSAFRPDEAVLDLARRVRADDGPGIAMFSNNSDLVREGLEAFWPAVMASLMPRIFSSDLGLTKPDPRAYQRVSEVLGLPPEQVLVVDDAPVNTAAAASLGFDVIHYTDPEGLASGFRARGLL